MPAPAASDGQVCNMNFITTMFKPSFGCHNKRIFNPADKGERQRKQRRKRHF
jgi:hypothetical protein